MTLHRGRSVDSVLITRASDSSPNPKLTAPSSCRDGLVSSVVESVTGSDGPDNNKKTKCNILMR